LKPINTLDPKLPPPIREDFKLKDISETSIPELKVSTKIEIISLMDNSIDFFASNKSEVQSLWKWTKTNHQKLPIAEHGFSVLVIVYVEDEVYNILFDTGISPDGVVRNAEKMGVDLNEVDYVVLSHGHYDHFGGLQAALNVINKTGLPLIAHDYMFKPRGTANIRGEIREHPPFPTPEQLGSVKIVNTKQPYLIANDSVCVTGEIPRKSLFETGYMQNRVFVDGKWHSDPLILDDRAIVLNLAQKGLVVISGCAHAGIINTIQYAQEITGVKCVYAVMGGFHLAGKDYESRIQSTVEELKTINPKLIVPFHCTGWCATNMLSKAFPDAFAHNSVGNLYRLK